jgi:site-specific DNA-methyltransferase (adenine-specific)
MGRALKITEQRTMEVIEMPVEVKRSEVKALPISGVTSCTTSEVYLMDCVQGLRHYPDNHFDLAVVDPPYGIGMDGGNVGYKGANNFEKKNWDKETPPTEYFVELWRVSKERIIWGGNYFDLPTSRCWLIWDKGEGFENRSYAECELAWTSFDKNTTKVKRDPLAKGDYKGKIHPCQKPVFLYEYIFKKYAERGQSVLDTHLGSGSSRIAANMAGLNFVGFEIDEDYFKAQEERWQRHVSQTRLF